MLSAHGGEIFIHTLHTSRSCLDDLPSVLENNILKVSDYRINDFAAIIRNFRLIPLKQFADRMPDRNLARLRTKYCKNTKYFPLTAGSTIVYNVRQVKMTHFNDDLAGESAFFLIDRNFILFFCLVFGANAHIDC